MSNSIITMNAAMIFWARKKIGLHIKFNIICIEKNIYPLAFLSSVFFNIYKNNATKIVMYKIVHTGAKIQFGGANGGLVKF